MYLYKMEQLVQTTYFINVKRLQISQNGSLDKDYKSKQLQESTQKQKFYKRQNI